MMNIKTFIGAKLFDDKGRLIRCHEEEGHSFVAQFNQLLYIAMSDVTTPVHDFINTLFSPVAGANQNNMHTDGAAGNQSVGIVVGTGTNPVTINDYNLQTVILHGTGSGQLDYPINLFVAPAVVGATCSFIQRRVFNNTSGGDISVSECGLFCYNAVSTKIFCLDRTLITPVLVPNGHALQLDYRISNTV
jgi:hypothetical protein